MSDSEEKKKIEFGEPQKEEELSIDESISESDGLESSKADSPEFKWYIVKTKTGQENRVVRSLRERVVSLKCMEFFLDILTPEETVVSNAGGRKRTLKKKFFPGYVLIKMIMNDRTWHLVKATDKISGFIGGTKEMPLPISDKEAVALTQQAKEGFKKQKSSIEFFEGETVRVTEGPFSSFVGTVEAVSEKGKLRVSVSIFGRPTPVELETTQVEKVSD
jgi:transcriptional antiterminator NusG